MQKQKHLLQDNTDDFGLNSADSTLRSRFLSVLQRSVEESGHQLDEPEIFSASTDSRFYRQFASTLVESGRRSIICLGFSPINNTPVIISGCKLLDTYVAYFFGCENLDSLTRSQ